MRPEDELLWLRRVRDLAQRLATEASVRPLLPRILDAAIELTEAERGFLVLLRGTRGDGSHRIKVEVARGFDQTALATTQSNISRTVVKRVLERGDGIVTSSETDADLIGVTSVASRRVLSIVAVPLLLRGEVRGVLYLDHRFQRDAFEADHLPILTSFAGQAALALETAELRERAPGERGDLEQVVALEEAAERAPEQVAPQLARFGRLLGGSPAMTALYEEVERASRTRAPVIIYGEPGSGKTTVAEEIHARSSAGEALRVLTCAAGSEVDLEAQLTQPGTLLIEEVGELDLVRQGRLLQALSAQGPCRVLATSRHDLSARAREGRFREDLFYRLDVLRIVVPPLRQRPGDVGLLFDAFRSAITRRRVVLSPKALELLSAHAWPGNARELRNEVERVVYLGEDRVSSRHLAPEIREGRGVAEAGASYAGKTLSEVERAMVAAALESCRGNKARAARQLGIPRSTLYHLLERYGLT